MAILLSGRLFMLISEAYPVALRTGLFLFDKPYRITKVYPGGLSRDLPLFHTPSGIAKAFLALITKSRPADGTGPALILVIMSPFVIPMKIGIYPKNGAGCGVPNGFVEQRQLFG